MSYKYHRFASSIPLCLTSTHTASSLSCLTSSRLIVPFKQSLNHFRCVPAFNRSSAGRVSDHSALAARQSGCQSGALRAVIIRVSEPALAMCPAGVLGRYVSRAPPTGTRSPAMRTTRARDKRLKEYGISLRDKQLRGLGAAMGLRRGMLKDPGTSRGTGMQCS